MNLPTTYLHKAVFCLLAVFLLGNCQNNEEMTGSEEDNKAEEEQRNQEESDIILENPDKDQLPDMMFYTLKVIRVSDSLEVVDQGQEIVKKDFNGLPFPPGEEPGTKFKCEVKDEGGKILRSQEVTAEFKYGDADEPKMAVIPFKFQLPEGSAKMKVSSFSNSLGWQNVTEVTVEW
jgi:hypothetical protein